MSRTRDDAQRAEALILALDIGSSSVRSAFVCEKGVRLRASTASRQYSVAYSSAGGAELDPGTLLRATRAVLRQTLQWRRNSRPAARRPIIAVAGSAFWHSLLALDRQRQPITPVFMWADSRPAPDAERLRTAHSERAVHARTGCMLRAPYWPAKLRWLRRTQPRLFRGTAHWISPAVWIYHEIFGAASTSHSMASGTGFYHLGTRAWDEELCQACGVTIRRLGELDDLAEIRAPLFAELRGLPVFTALGDGATSNLGSGADRPGLVALNLGTSAAVREIVPAGKSRARARFGLFRHVVDDARCVIGGAISNAGNLREWMLRELKVSPNDEKALDRAAAAASPLVVQPSWVNERAPTWPEDVRGAIAGFTPATTAADLLRAATAASYYRLADILDLLCDGRHPELVVSGGVLHSPAALHLLADCLGHDLRACPELESSLRGGAIHALTELGLPAPHLGPGKIIRHRPALAAQHRLRRRRQREFERRLA